MVSRTTENIRIDVHSEYIPQESDPAANYFFFAYHITITNMGSDPAKLLSRHWLITNGLGEVEEVRGPGVVGEQPRILPGHSYEYTSACPLRTSTGSMQGSYQMIRDDGTAFDAEVPEFHLFEPGAVEKFH